MLAYLLFARATSKTHLLASLPRALYRPMRLSLILGHTFELLLLIDWWKPSLEQAQQMGQWSESRLLVSELAAIRVSGDYQLVQNLTLYAII